MEGLGYRACLQLMEGLGYRVCLQLMEGLGYRACLQLMEGLGYRVCLQLMEGLGYRVCLQLMEGLGYRVCLQLMEGVGYRVCRIFACPNQSEIVMQCCLLLSPNTRFCCKDSVQPNIYLAQFRADHSKFRWQFFPLKMTNRKALSTVPFFLHLPTCTHQGTWLLDWSCCRGRQTGHQSRSHMHGRAPGRWP